MKNKLTEIKELKEIQETMKNKNKIKEYNNKKVIEKQKHKYNKR